MSLSAVEKDYRQRAKKSRFLLSSRDIILIFSNFERPSLLAEAKEEGLKRTEEEKKFCQ